MLLFYFLAIVCLFSRIFWKSAFEKDIIPILSIIIAMALSAYNAPSTLEKGKIRLFFNALQPQYLHPHQKTYQMVIL